MEKILENWKSEIGKKLSFCFDDFSVLIGLIGDAAPGNTVGEVSSHVAKYLYQAKDWAKDNIEGIIGDGAEEAVKGGLDHFQENEGGGDITSQLSKSVFV